ncbi:hypothetical protein QFC21_000044 [Naganishia friedmannii]|uniref:Uncharacterized protein n=1 Tax=Naganishia friedmannii TaxID=89922 RepID=A0ACC2WBW7_9TREE|nr:hypothetical protein QFC21_000044 [Naganishia friedmannii]
MLLHRTPVLTPSLTPFESTYYAYTSRLRMALSNPAPLDFFYKKGSLAERRFLRAQYERERAVFGERLAGRKVDVGDIPEEAGVKLVRREVGDEPAAFDGSAEQQQQQQKEVEGGADKMSVERVRAGDVYLLVKEKATGRWGLPVGPLNEKEALHEAAARNLSEGLGQGMDTWLVTRKPVGMIEGKTPEEHTFIFKSHILAGQPVLATNSQYAEYAWLTKPEIRQAMTSGGPGAAEWEQVEPLLS